MPSGLMDSSSLSFRLANGLQLLCPSRYCQDAELRSAPSAPTDDPDIPHRWESINDHIVRCLPPNRKIPTWFDHDTCLEAPPVISKKRHGQRASQKKKVVTLGC